MHSHAKNSVDELDVDMGRSEILLALASSGFIPQVGEEPVRQTVSCRVTTDGRLVIAGDVQTEKLEAADDCYDADDAIGNKLTNTTPTDVTPTKHPQHEPKTGNLYLLKEFQADRIAKIGDKKPNNVPAKKSSKVVKFKRKRSAIKPEDLKPVNPKTVLTEDEIRAQQEAYACARYECPAATGTDGPYASAPSPDTANKALLVKQTPPPAPEPQ